MTRLGNRVFQVGSADRDRGGGRFLTKPREPEWSSGSEAAQATVPVLRRTTGLRDDRRPHAAVAQAGAFTPNSTSAVFTVPAVRPGAVWYCQ